MAGEEVPRQVDMQTLEKEFGLEADTPAAESDEAVDAAEGAEATPADTGKSLDQIAAQGPDGEIDVKTIEHVIKRDELVRDLDDNIVIMDELAKLEATPEEVVAEREEEEAADAAQEETEKAGGESEEGEEEAEEGEEAAAGEEAEAAADGSDEEGEAEDGAAEGAEAAAEGDNFDDWLTEHVTTQEDRDDLTSSLTDAGAQVTYDAGGTSVTEPLKETLQKAAGFMGQTKVTQTFQEAADLKKKAEAKNAETMQAIETTKAEVEAITGQIQDPEKFADFLIGNAGLDYIKTLQGLLEGTIQEADDNPAAFTNRQKMASIDAKLDKLLSGGSEAAPPATQDGDKAAEEGSTAKLDLSDVPEDLGFVRGKGYPNHLTGIALNEAKAVLQGAEALGQANGVDMTQAVDAWNKGGRNEPIKDVLTGLLKKGARDAPKRKIAASPPVRKSSKGQRARSGGKKPKTAAPAAGKAPAWDDIEKAVASELAAANQGRELQS